MKWYHACLCGSKWFCPREIFCCPRCGASSKSPSKQLVPWEVVMKVSRIAVGDIEADPDNPRKAFIVEELLALGNNMALHGQQVPVIVYPFQKGYRLADGERRWRAAKLVGVTDLLAIVHPEKPNDATLGMVQMSLEVHKVSLSPMERSDLLAKIKAQTGLGVGELAERLQISQPLVTKLISLQRLSAAARAAIEMGRLDIEKAYLLSAEECPIRQADLLREANSLSRDQLRSKLRHKNPDEPRTKRAVFALPGGISITLQGIELTIGDAIERFGDVIKELRRGMSQSLDIVTVQKVMKDKAK
jgi:ParB family transcriptional regulator, chromosome partitioning protein